MLLKSIRHNLDELIYLLDQLSDHDYKKPCETLNNTTIGEQTASILEMFKCLENGYDSGILNYGHRAGNNQIQTETEFAKQCLIEIKMGLKIENKTLYLEKIINGLAIRIQTSYYRELLYNLENSIHHQTLIKIAVSQLEKIPVHEI